MRYARKLALLAIGVLAFMAFGVSNATAQETPVNIINEASEQDCDFATANCAVHVVGTSQLTLPDMTTLVSNCTDEFTAVFDADGSGHVVNQSLTGGGCNSIPCSTGSVNDEWPLHGDVRELAPNEYGTEIEFCLFGGGGVKSYCEVPLHIEEDPSENHHYTITISNEMHGSGDGEFQCPNGLWVSGSWETEEPHETGDEIEIQHL